MPPYVLKTTEHQETQLVLCMNNQLYKYPPTRVGVHSNYYIMSHPKNVHENAPKPKSKIQNPKFAQEELLHKAPKSKIQNPKSKIQNPKSKIQNPKSKIQNPKSEIQNPKSKIQNPKSKIRNPKSKIQNSGNLGRWGPHAKECYITIQNPKSPKSGRKNLDFGLGNFGFWIPDFGCWGGPGDVPLGNSVTAP